MAYQGLTCFKIIHCITGSLSESAATEGEEPFRFGAQIIHAPKLSARARGSRVLKNPSRCVIQRSCFRHLGPVSAAATADVL